MLNSNDVSEYLKISPSGLEVSNKKIEEISFIKLAEIPKRSQLFTFLSGAM